MSNLTTINDFKQTITKGKPALDEKELEEATNDLLQSSYPKVNRAYCDATFNNQLYSLHSFIPASGAKPDKDGVYGLLKIRGTFPSEDEANDRAVDIVQNIDSYNRIFTCRVGVPVPLVSADFESNHKINRINVNDKVADVYKDNIRNKVVDEQARIKELKEREKLLLEDAKLEKDPEIDDYTTLRVKRAQVAMVFIDSIDKLLEMRKVVLDSDKKIKAYDESNPEFKEEYLIKYDQARKSVGLDSSTADSQKLIEFIQQIPEIFYHYDIQLDCKSLL